MMSVLYNFVKVDNDAFLSDPRYLQMVISMCKTVSVVDCHGNCLNSYYVYMYCVVCLVVCLTLLASFFLLISH